MYYIYGSVWAIPTYRVYDNAITQQVVFFGIIITLRAYTRSNLKVIGTQFYSGTSHIGLSEIRTTSI